MKLHRVRIDDIQGKTDVEDDAMTLGLYLDAIPADLVTSTMDAESHVIT
jgi:hypothetical protein